MKVVIVLALVGLAASAPALIAAPANVASTGSSSVSRSEDGTGNYQFSYTEQGLTGGSQRSEQGDAFGRKTGSYALSDADGRQRIVSYVADATGFRASIQTNEPGTAPLAGADTAISAPDTTGIAALTNQRTSEQLTALANAPPPPPEEVAPVAAANFAAPNFAAANFAAPNFAAPNFAAQPIQFVSNPNAERFRIRSPQFFPVAQ